MTTTWERFLAVLRQFSSPLVKGGIRDAQLASYLCDGLAAGLRQSDSLFFEFFCGGF